MESQSRGLLLGVDGQLENGWRLGVLGGYQDSDMDLDARASSAEVDSLHLGVYASKRWDNWHLSLGGTFGQHQLETQRQALGQTLAADYHAQSWQAFAETGYRFESSTGWVQPFVGVSWQKQRNDAFKESGGSAALAVERTESSTGFGSVGVRGGAELGADPLPVRVQGSISWRHAFDDVDTVSEHRFLGGDSRFSVKGTPIAENTVVMDAGLVVPVSENTDISFGYRGEHSDESEVQEGYIQMSVRF
ncbi:autotransporter outer membrane beta-barrel domain-containing protein [Marinobacterium stanieri]|uniref:Outer membrane autotransporter barrel domain-containing protein n=1 Tax=Marinobacterium stanieri TaxID=49186 RepID=A0A1N6U685_9GAMM|nr:autotransporter outer membrane beta-barrel domain-containing protein [Marinobacterium stanieri]SIQ61113.1 outer membrane autotransporter barrel domain-containing protein [Marinobacterium stanieri]